MDTLSYEENDKKPLCLLRRYKHVINFLLANIRTSIKREQTQAHIGSIGVSWG